jgi:hypothetical protein
MRVFLDANISFSAAKSDGAVRALLRLLVERGHAGVVDAFVVEEARRNLLTKGPDALETLDALLGQLHAAPAAAGSLRGSAAIKWLPEKDQPVLDAAIRSGCDALVTGDRTHFGPGYGKTFGGVAIHSPRSLAELLRS